MLGTPQPRPRVRIPPSPLLRSTIAGLLSAVALLAGATSAQADSGAITDVVASPFKLTFTAHVEWSSCVVPRFGGEPVCRWFGTVRVQDPDTECTDPNAGRSAWVSQQQRQPAVLDSSVSWPYAPPGERLTLCMWVYSITNSGTWAPLARADVTIPEIPAPPPTSYTPSEAKAVAVDFIGYLGEDTSDISATCAGGQAPVCTTSWVDRSSHWRGRLTMAQDRVSFVGEVSANSCLKRHRRTCWKPAQQSWGDE